MSKKKKRIKLDEYSKLLALIVFIVGIGLFVVYCVALLSNNMPSDAILYVAGALICGGDAFYSAYQAFLKNSRNVNKVLLDETLDE